MASELSAGRRKFCREYLKVLSVEKAAEAVGISEDRAYELLENEAVQGELCRLREILSAGITADDVVRKLAFLAFSECDKLSAGDRLKLLEKLLEVKGAGSGGGAEFLKALEDIGAE